MATDTPSEWLDTYERVSHDARMLTSETREKEAAPGGVSSKDRRQFGRRLEDIQKLVDQLDKSLSKMEMNPIAFRIGDGELIRRQSLMTQLKQLVATADAVLSGKAGARGQLLGQGKRPKEFSDTEETRDLSNQDLLSHQQQMVSKQDEHLDSILVGVGTLKHMGEDIGQELDLHHSLLRDLDASVTNTDTTIQASTHKVEDIQEKEQGCWPLIIIILLLIGIVVLMVV